MARPIVQVPIDPDLLAALDALSRSRRMSRSALIREACHRYVQLAADEARDLAYEAAYRRIPEGGAVGEAQIRLAGEALPYEDW